MERPTYVLPTTVRVLAILWSFLLSTTCLSSELVSGNNGLSEDFPLVNLSFPSNHLVSQYQDTSINGLNVKLESFGYSEPANHRLLYTGRDAPVPDMVTTVVVQNASLDHNYIGEVSAKTQFMFVFNYTEEKKITATRIQFSSSLADKVYPVTCVARQQEGILSWQLPLEMEESYSYWMSSRTLCPLDKNHKEHIVKEQLIYVTVSTMSNEKKDFNLTAFKINDFQVE
ncbi:SID1 transmembrane family member 1 [Elysia marginata]|uniref:SID1 transmembrane family member 1 n=1 Tax=Elysia marginata TaxID=1093978 RepID=A0AAV4EIC3_9GAST|nr:SID1 transmembrane family member 1 [Elysia marginata]